MTEKLSPNFLNELFKAVLREKSIADIAVKHLEYQFLPNPEYKEVWKAIQSNYKLNGFLPSYGILSEQYKNKPEILQQLSNIKEADMPGTEALIAQFELFVRRAMFSDLHSDMKELWEDGKQEKAFEVLQEKSEKIANFSLSSIKFTKVVSGFEERYKNNRRENLVNQNEPVGKAKWGIDRLDERTFGGVDKGDIALITARSGVGKSKILKHIAMTNARLGKKVLHFQLEGSEKEATDAYDTIMSGSTLQDIETTSLSEDRLKAVVEASRKVKGEIDIIAPEKFGAFTMSDIRFMIVEYIKMYGDPDVVVIDYIDKADPGDGKRYSTNMEGEKARRSALAHLFKDLAVEFKFSGFTATQASDVKEDVWNNPNKVLTRSDVKGDKNVVDPYSYHFTLNRTKDETKEEIMRIHEDKMRKYEGGRTHKICTAYKHEKFYDRKRTLNLFGE